MKKIIYIIMLTSIIITSIGINSNIYAGSHSAGEIVKDADTFVHTGELVGSSIIKQNDMKDLSDTVYNILLVVAIIAAVLVGAILGLKFIMEGAEGKAEIQKALVPYVIGCVVAFGAFTIWKIIVDVLQGM